MVHRPSGGWRWQFSNEWEMPLRWDKTQKQCQEAREQHDSKQERLSHCHVPVRMQEHKIALTGDRERSEQLRHERFGCADRSGRLKSICKNSATLSSMLLCPANRLEQWPRIPQCNSEMGWRIWKERLKALSFSIVEIELKSSSKKVRKVNPTIPTTERQDTGGELGAATSRACLIRYNLLKNTLIRWVMTRLPRVEDKQITEADWAVSKLCCVGWRT